jgi:hypothetical protein
MNNEQNIIFPVSPYAEGMPFLQEDTFYQSSPTSSSTSYQGDDFRTSFYNPFEIKHRKRTSRAQFKVLEKTFLENPKPNAAIRRWLAQKLSMTPRGVQVWFQNRRAKEKTINAKKPAVTTPPPQQPSPEQSVCTCNDCLTPMSRTMSHPSFYSDSSSNGEEDDFLMTPMTTFVDQTFAQPMYDYPELINNRKMTAPPSQDWMFATPAAPLWPIPNELAYNPITFDQRRYSSPIIPEDRYVQSTEVIIHSKYLLWPNLLT